MTFEELTAHAKGELREDFGALTQPNADIAPRLYTSSPAGLDTKPIPREMLTPNGERYLFHTAIPLVVIVTGVTVVAISMTVYERLLPVPPSQMTAQEIKTLKKGRIPRGWIPKEQWPTRETLLLVVLDRTQEQSWFADIDRDKSRKPALGEWRTYGLAVSMPGMTETISRALRC